MLIGWRSLKVDQLVLTWRTGPVPATTMAMTFVLTLIIPLQYAVLVGVGLAVLLHVARQSNQVVVKHWVFDDDHGFPTETDPPAELPHGEVVVLATYGSLFFASAAAFEAQLPRPVGAGTHGVVVLRLRAKEELGSTVVQVLIRYAELLLGAPAPRRGCPRRPAAAVTRRRPPRRRTGCRRSRAPRPPRGGARRAGRSRSGNVVVVEDPVLHDDGSTGVPRAAAPPAPRRRAARIAAG